MKTKWKAVAHTPGPWRTGGVQIWSDNQKRCVVGPECGGYTVAEVQLTDEGCGRCEANARLIAAAPDLLEACKNFALGRKEARECESEMLAAIAKAEGR